MDLRIGKNETDGSGGNGDGSTDGKPGDDGDTTGGDDGDGDADEGGAVDDNAGGGSGTKNGTDPAPDQHTVPVGKSGDDDDDSDDSDGVGQGEGGSGDAVSDAAADHADEGGPDARPDPKQKPVRFGTTSNQGGSGNGPAPLVQRVRLPSGEEKDVPIGPDGQAEIPPDAVPIGDPTSPGAEPDSAYQSNSTPWPVIGGVSCAAIIVAAVGFLVWRRRKLGQDRNSLDIENVTPSGSPDLPHLAHIDDDGASQDAWDKYLADQELQRQTRDFNVASTIGGPTVVENAAMTEFGSFVDTEYMVAPPRAAAAAVTTGAAAIATGASTDYTDPSAPGSRKASDSSVTGLLQRRLSHRSSFGGATQAETWVQPSIYRGTMVSMAMTESSVMPDDSVSVIHLKRTAAGPTSGGGISMPATGMDPGARVPSQGSLERARDSVMERKQRMLTMVTEGDNDDTVYFESASEYSYI